MTEPIAPSAPAGQGATPSAEPVPISSAPAAGTVPQSAPPPAATIDWLTGAPEDITGFVQNKGWKTPVDAITSYKQLEKHMGTPADKLLRLPDFDKADPTELGQFYTKLGRPAEPNGYEIPVPEGMDTSFAEAAKAKFHELGLTAKQAKALAEWNNEYASTMSVQQQEAYKQTIAAENESLKKEWGQAYDQEIGMAKNAAKALGLSPEKIDKLEQSLGFADLMRTMANIGKRIGEDKFVSGDSVGGNGVLTPAGAQARIQQLRGDKDWTAKYLSGNVQARAEMERLMQFAYPS
jgi:hypothetical protein